MRYQRWWDHWLCTTAGVGVHTRGNRAQDLLWKSFWCRHFAMINAAGLRKILKYVCGMVSWALRINNPLVPTVNLAEMPL